MGCYLDGLLLALLYHVARLPKSYPYSFADHIPDQSDTFWKMLKSSQKLVISHPSAMRWLPWNISRTRMRAQMLEGVVWALLCYAMMHDDAQVRVLILHILQGPRVA